MIHRTKSGKYCIVARIRKDGKIVHRRETIACSKEQAKARLEEIKAEIRAGRPLESSLKSNDISTFKELIEFYREKSPKAPFSPEYDKKVIRLRDEFNSVSLVGFADRFEAYIKLLRNAKKSAATINRPIEIVRAAFQVAYSLGMVKGNPITKTRFPEIKEIPRDISLSLEEKNNLVETARNNPRTVHIADALNFALQVPVRKSELVNMRVKDIDLFSKCIRVHNGETKNDKGTDKPIPPDMIDFFMKRKKEGKPEDPVFCRIIKGDRKNRTGENYKVVSLGDFKRAWQTVKEDAGRPDIRFHDTRHISATDMVDAGTPERAVMDVAGWNTNMLANYYHRNNKKSLGLVQFKKSNCEPVVNTIEKQGS